MDRDSNSTYAPINTPTSVTGGVWIVDGSVIRFGPPLLNIPFSTRMTIICVGDGDLFIHSPTSLTPAFKSKVESLGSPRWTIGPNRLHYWWIPDRHTAFPDADIYLAPRIKEQAGERIDFDFHPSIG